jgi:hypothetical protein
MDRGMGDSGPLSCRGKLESYSMGKSGSKSVSRPQGPESRRDREAGVAGGDGSQKFQFATNASRSRSRATKPTPDGKFKKPAFRP